MTRAYPMTWGAQVRDDGVRFRLWAPGAASVSLVVCEGAERDVRMDRLPNGWFETVDPDSGPGTRYQYEIEGDLRVSDPAARFAPDGPSMPSEVIDPAEFSWPREHRVRPFEEMVFYELHVGSFTPSGTYAEAATRLPHLVDLGITAVELMPLAERPGARNWGYDGVLTYAPSALYGRPEDLKSFIVAAHDHGLAVFLDVVYNHFGPQDNYLYTYARRFFTPAHHTPWGNAIDYASEGNEPVRRFVIDNACYWLYEYSFDGLRLDATQEIYDERREHVLHELAASARASVDRQIYLVVEDDRNNVENFALGYDAQWNDDVHHCLHVALTGERDGYYRDYFDDPIGLLGKALTEGFAYQGEPSPFRDGRSRGAPTAGVPLKRFVNCLQNHDQIGNRAFGERITDLAPLDAVRAAVAVLLLAPSPPLLFMGEEWRAASPFLFFCDFEPNLARSVTEGRRNEFARFEKFADPNARARIPDPSSVSTFERSKLRWDELSQGSHREWLDFYRGLLHVRRNEVAPRIAAVSSEGTGYEMRGECGLSAWWKAGGEILRLEANLGAAPQGGFEAQARGRILFETRPAFANGTAPSWSVRWTLAQ